MIDEKSEDIKDEEIEEFLKEEEEDIDKSIINDVDPEISERINEMGFIWDAVHQKLEEDNFCFECHKQILTDENKEPMRQMLQFYSLLKEQIPEIY